MLLHNQFLHFFFLFYGSTIFTYAHPVTDTELSRRQDPPGVEFLEGYELRELPKADQGKHSVTYNVVNGFVVGGKRIPAILKIIPDEDKTDQSKTRKEIEFLGNPAVDLLLQWGWAQDCYSIVIKNVQGFDPPLKPLYQHYLDDDTLVASSFLVTAALAVYNRLLKFAEEDNLFYFDFHLQNIFFDKDLRTVMPIDWAPPGRYDGVETIVNEEEKKSKIARLKAVMEASLPTTYSVDKFEDALIRRGKDLWPEDINRNRSMSVNGITYYLRRTGYSQIAKTFRITDGFEGQPALLKMMKGYERGDEFRSKLEKKGLLLDSEGNSKRNWYNIIYKEVKHGTEGNTSVPVVVDAGI